MASKIEWTNETLNTISGCTKYSEGCQNCYAEKMHKRLTAMGQEKYNLPFNVIKMHNPLTESAKRITKNTNMCFVNSMSDTFHKDVPDEYIYSLLQCLNMYGHVKFQVLTKRAERLPNFSYPENIWLGVTVEKAKYKSRIDYLRKTDAKIKFLSCEPLLEDLGELDLSGIDWVIVGGESGNKARPMHPEWVKNIQKQCEKQNVAFFFKQWGEWCPPLEIDEFPEKNTKFIVLLNDGRMINGLYPQSINDYEKETGETLDLVKFQAHLMCKVGKSKAGSYLGRRYYKEYPKE